MTKMSEAYRTVVVAFDEIFGLIPSLSENKGALIINGEWSIKPNRAGWVLTRKLPRPDSIVQMTGIQWDFVEVNKTAKPLTDVIKLLLTQFAHKRINLWTMNLS